MAADTRNRDSLLRPKKSVGLPAEGGSILPTVRGADYLIDGNGCWIWQRGIDNAGYGRLQSPSHRERRAHRAYYFIAKGPIPEGWHVHHRCHVRPCVNPAHLEATPPVPHLTRHRQADSTLTWEDVRAIRAENKAGVGIYDQSERYELRISTLHRIIMGTTWIDPEYVPGVEKACDECEETFRTTKVNKRFCCKRCRYRHTGRRTSATYYARHLKKGRTA